MSRALNRNCSEEVSDGENMVSNLPLLFAAGYPTSLEKITESQLETFIPFMVQCSLGQIQLSNANDCSEPEWWPEDIDFTIPLVKPLRYSDNWFAKLKEIVAICYTFHKSVFLLRFCENLSMYQPEYLRFINNYNSTTSLFDRISNKLLVTFRNENMLYDQVMVNQKKTLMPRTQSSQSMDNQSERMVEQALFDIYLCDNCEAELYSLEAYREHEKICQEDESDDDDVILIEEEYEMVDKVQQQASFLQNFQLSSNSIPFDQQIKHTTPHKRNMQNSFSNNNNNNNNNNNSSNNNNISNSGIKDMPTIPDKKVRRMPRRTHAAMVLSKCPTIPITSPAGQRLIKTSNATMTEDYLRERLERSERFCSAPIIGRDGSNRPKFMDKRLPIYSISSYRKTSPSNHFYHFPRRQLSTKYRERSLKILQSIMIKQTHCKPVFVKVKRLTYEDIEAYREERELMRIEARCRMQPAKMARRTKIVDFIDLCSSDDENDVSVDDNNDGATETSNEQSSDNSSDANGTKENINYESQYQTNQIDSDTMCDIQLMCGNRQMNGDILRQASVVATNYDSRSNFFNRDIIENLLSNHQSISLISRNKPLQHQNQDNTNRYLNGKPNSPKNGSLYDKHMGNEITITRKPVATVPTSKQSSNFISIDLTL